MEKRLSVVGFEGLYEVSDMGRVRSLERTLEKQIRRGKEIVSRRYGCVLKAGIFRGYEGVILCRGGKHKNMQVHRLVAQAFIPNTENKPEVNHKNGIKNDNRAENLERCTSRENQLHAFSIGLQKRKFGKDHCGAKKIGQYTKEGKLLKIRNCGVEIESQLGISRQCISMCCTGKTKISQGFKRSFIF